MRHRIAKIQDSEALGELNHQLIKDEGHRNSMATPELIERMRSWLITDYRALPERGHGAFLHARARSECVKRGKNPFPRTRTREPQRSVR
jgi:hypothetical protein